MYKRKVDDERNLRAAGVEGAALEALLKLGAGVRHASRVEHVRGVQQALGWAKFKFLVLLDSLGIGGYGPWGSGEGTRRVPAFNTFGSGRKFGDGQAWTAAIEEVNRWRGRWKLYPTAAGVVVESAEEKIEVRFPADRELVWWLAVLSGEILAKKAGFADTRYREIESEYEVNGSMQEWSELYNKVVLEQEVLNKVYFLWKHQTVASWEEAEGAAVAAGYKSLRDAVGEGELNAIIEESRTQAGYEYQRK